MNQQNRYGHADADIAMEIAHLMDEPAEVRLGIIR